MYCTACCTKYLAKGGCRSSVEKVLGTLALSHASNGSHRAEGEGPGAQRHHCALLLSSAMCQCLPSPPLPPPPCRSLSPPQTAPSRSLPPPTPPPSLTSHNRDHHHLPIHLLRGLCGIHSTPVLQFGVCPGPSVRCASPALLNTRAPSRVTKM